MRTQEPVLILLLLEYPLGEIVYYGFERIIQVLILLLLEYPLRPKIPYEYEQHTFWS